MTHWEHNIAFNNKSVENLNNSKKTNDHFKRIYWIRRHFNNIEDIKNNISNFKPFFDVCTDNNNNLMINEKSQQNLKLLINEIEFYIPKDNITSLNSTLSSENIDNKFIYKFDEEYKNNFINTFNKIIIKEIDEASMAIEQWKINAANTGINS